MQRRRVTGILVLCAVTIGIAACGIETAIRAAWADCGATSGRTVDLDIESPGPSARRAMGHLPPCYDDNDDHYPAVYLLHGAGLGVDSWIDAPVSAGDAPDSGVVDGSHNVQFLVDRTQEWLHWFDSAFET